MARTARNAPHCASSKEGHAIPKSKRLVFFHLHRGLYFMHVYEKAAIVQKNHFQQLGVVFVKQAEAKTPFFSFSLSSYSNYSLSDHSNYAAAPQYMGRWVLDACPRVRVRDRPHNRRQLVVIIDVNGIIETKYLSPTVSQHPLGQDVVVKPAPRVHLGLNVGSARQQRMPHGTQRSALLFI